MRLAGLAYNIGSNDRTILAEVVKGIVFNTTAAVLASMVVPRSWEARPPSSYTVNTPNSMKEIRSLYLEGKYSIFGNLPIPKVENLQNHAYVPLRACIEDMLGHGVPMEPIMDLPPFRTQEKRRVETIVQSQHCQRWLEKTSAMRSGPCINLWLNEWSDDFEPNNQKKTGVQSG